MQYKDTIGEPFDWLYIDADTLREQAAKNGYVVVVVAEGEHYDYLARITKMRKASREMYATFAFEVLDKAPYVTVSFTRPVGKAEIVSDK